MRKKQSYENLRWKEEIKCQKNQRDSDNPASLGQWWRIWDFILSHYTQFHWEGIKAFNKEVSHILESVTVF